MSERSGIFIAYCFPEKKWFDRVHAAIKPIAGNAGIAVWDERRLRGGPGWKAELTDLLANRKIVVLVVSDIFLTSEFITRAKLPAMLESERGNGLRICWVLAGHCIFEAHGLKPEEAAHDINQALDGLGVDKREAELEAVARHVAGLLGAPAPSKAPAAVPTPAALEALDAALETRRTTIFDLRRLARLLFFGALGVAALSLPSALLGLTHFLFLVGFAAFIACQALLVRARIDFLGQGLIGMRYTRSGLADETLPSRQRDPLVRKAAEIVG